LQSPPFIGEEPPQKAILPTSISKLKLVQETKQDEWPECKVPDTPPAQSKVYGIVEVDLLVDPQVINRHISKSSLDERSILP